MRVLRWLILLLPILAAACGEDNLANAAGEVVAEPKVLEFGGVFLGEEGKKDVSFRNLGRTQVTLRVTESPASIAVEPKTIQVGSGGATKWTFRFVPQEVGAIEGSVLVAVEGGTNKQIELPVVAVGLSRDVITEEVLDFGAVRLGDSRTLPLEVGSGSEGRLSLALAVDGADRNAFTIDTDRLELEPGGVSTVQVTFKPMARANHTARISMKSCAGCQEHVVRLRGLGAVGELQPSPTSIDFGTVTPGSVATQTLRVSNTGNMPVLVGGVSFARAEGHDFVADFSGFPREIAGGETISFEVSFAPPADAPVEAQGNAIRFVESDGQTLIFEVPVQGRPGGPRLEAMPAFIHFGTQPIGLDVTSLVVVRNVAEEGDVRVIAAALEGRDASAFSVAVDPPLPADVGNPASVATFGVTFRPTVPGNMQAELVIVTDDDEQPEFRIPIEGDAREVAPCDLVVSPPSIRFGLVANNRAHVRSADLVNVGTDDCIVWDVKLDSAGSPFFSTAGVPEDTTVIPPGGRLPLAVRFYPQGTSLRRHESRLFYRHSTPSTPRGEIAISGLPSRYDLSAAPNPVAFGAHPQGYRSLVYVTVTNNGSLAPTITHGSVSADTSTEFDFDPAAGVPGVLHSGSTVTFAATYAPSDVGADYGQYEVWVQDQDEPFLIDATGAGTDEECGDLCAAPQAVCPGALTVRVNNQIDLVGGGVDPTGDPLTCTWRVIGAPTGARAAPANSAQCITTFIPDVVGSYVLELTVRDPMHNESTCTVDVEALPYGGLWVEMFWSINGDIDLHVLHPNAGPPSNRASWTDSTWTCFYSNCAGGRSLEWDLPGPQDNPSLDRDDITQTGPENTRINVPSSSHIYSVGFKNFSNSHLPQVTYNIYCGGALLNAGNNVFPSQSVGTFTWVGDVQFDPVAGCTFTPRQIPIP